MIVVVAVVSQLLHAVHPDEVIMHWLSLLTSFPSSPSSQLTISWWPTDLTDQLGWKVAGAAVTNTDCQPVDWLTDWPKHPLTGRLTITWTREEDQPKNQVSVQLSGSNCGHMCAQLCVHIIVVVVGGGVKGVSWYVGREEEKWESTCPWEYAAKNRLQGIPLKSKNSTESGVLQPSDQ